MSSFNALVDDLKTAYQAGLDCWDDGRSPLEWGGELLCGDLEVHMPLVDALKDRVQREDLETAVGAKFSLRWNGESYDLLARWHVAPVAN